MDSGGERGFDNMACKPVAANSFRINEILIPL